MHAHADKSTNTSTPAEHAQTTATQHLFGRDGIKIACAPVQSSTLRRCAARSSPRTHALGGWGSCLVSISSAACMQLALELGCVKLRMKLLRLMDRVQPRLREHPQDIVHRRLQARHALIHRPQLRLQVRRQRWP